MKKNKIIIVAIGALLLVTACTPIKSQLTPVPKKLDEVTVLLDWTPNTNHTGLYVAAENGYFADNGLNVSIIQPSEGTPPQLVATGKAAFAVSYQEAVTEARSQNIPIVSIAAIIQHNTSGFASLKKSNITSVKDFEGKRYGGWGAPSEEAVLQAVMEKQGADFKKVKNITLGMTDFFGSIDREADFEWIFFGWDGIEAKRRGMDINMIMVKDLDPMLDYYTPVLITSEDLINTKSELVQRFASAVKKGYEFAIQQPKEAAQLLLRQVPELNHELVVQSQEWLSKEYQSDAPYWGYQKSGIWKGYADWMTGKGLLTTSVDTTKAFTNQFIQ
jgi:ABC-type nitrate/sulfonate/bicarbonate transport system substrate-binding protein